MTSPDNVKQDLVRTAEGMAPRIWTFGGGYTGGSTFETKVGATDYTSVYALSVCLLPLCLSVVSVCISVFAY